jgi:hypothetical protein
MSIEAPPLMRRRPWVRSGIRLGFSGDRLML